MGTLESKVHQALENPDSEKIVREVFESLDSNHNGTLDKEEYKIFIKLMLGHDSTALKSEVSK